MDQREFSQKINALVDDIRREALGGEALDFLSKCVRAYSSKGHLWNNHRDLELVRKLSPPPQRILDFGCGIGIQTYLLAEMGYRVTGLETVCDKSLEGFLKQKAQVHIETRDESMRVTWRIIKNRNPHVDFDVYDGKSLPYKSESFDAVFSYAVLEHIPKGDVPGIVKGICRILKPGGIFYVFQLPQVYSYTEFLARKLNLEAHEFLWSFPEMRGVLDQSGFEVLHMERADIFFNHPFRLVNPFFPLMKPMSRLVLATPLSIFCHHLSILGRKPTLDTE